MVTPLLFAVGFTAAGWATTALRLRAALESEQRLRGENFRLQDQVDDLISDFVDMQRERDDAEGERDAERVKVRELDTENEQLGHLLSATIDESNEIRAKYQRLAGAVRDVISEHGECTDDDEAAWHGFCPTCNLLDALPPEARP